MSTLEKLQALGAPTWYLKQLQQRHLFAGCLQPEDVAGPLVLQLGYTQAVNKRLANLTRKLESEKSTAKSLWARQVKHSLQLQDQLAAKNRCNLALLQENEQLKKDMLRGLPHGGVFGECKKTYAERDALRVELNDTKRKLSESAFRLEVFKLSYDDAKALRQAAQQERDDLKAKLGAAERTMKTALHMEEQANFRVGDLCRERDTLTRELAASKALAERWCKDFHDVNQDRITLQAAVKRHEAEIDSVLAKPKAELERARKGLAQTQDKLVAAARELAILRTHPTWRDMEDIKAELEQVRKQLQSEQQNVAFHQNDAKAVRAQRAALRQELVQAVAAKDAAVEEARKWKGAYRALKDATFGQRCSVPFVVNGRTSCKEPNLSNPPRSGKAEFNIAFDIESILRKSDIGMGCHPAHKNLTGDSFLTREDLERARKACEPAHPGLPSNFDRWTITDQRVVVHGKLVHPDGSLSYIRTIDLATPSVVTSSNPDRDIVYTWELHRKHEHSTQTLVLRDWTWSTNRGVDRAIPGSEKTVVQAGHPVGDGKGFKALYEFDVPCQRTNWYTFWANAIAVHTPRMFVSEYQQAPAPKPLTLKVKDVKIGDWLWHDATHPSKVVFLWRNKARNIVTALRTKIGGAEYHWKAATTPDGYILTLEKTWKS